MNPTPSSKLFWLLLLAGFWALFGLTGRDAWKPEEAINLAPILDSLSRDGGIWSSPAPLHTWLSGLLARVTDGWLGVQDGARLSSGVFALTSLALIALAARQLFGRGFSSAAVLAMMGCLGLMLRIHAQAPEPALLAAWAALLAGITLGRNARVSAGGILIGLALAALTLGLRGLPDLVAGLLLAGIPLLSRDWRHSGYPRALAMGLGLFALVAAAALVQIQTSGQLGAWWASHGLAEFPSWATRSRALSEFPWFAWPLWPLALAAVWNEHRRLGRAKELHLPLLALLIALMLVPVPAWSREGSLLPMLPPLALLAAYSLETLKRGAAQAFYWFGVACFLFFLFAFWIYFFAIEWGVPTRLAAHLARLTPTYRPGSVGSVNLLLGLAATGLWLLAIPLFPRAKIRPVLVWASGMVLLWTLLITLYRPWVEAGWGYRPLIVDLRAHLPADACLRIETDPAMRTMLRYHLHPAQQPHCAWLLTTKRLTHETPLWEGARPRQKQLRYRLYHLDS
jgi:4-amino-4-deoxy-L-arabinose transferase-like glycosyltransferase